MNFTKLKKSLPLKEIFFCGLILSTLTLESCGVNGKNAKSINTELSDIVNGKAVTLKNENSHNVVALVADKNDGQALCTGTIVAPSVILTAAHCVDDSPRSLHVVFGLTVQKAKEVREADKVIQHSNWNRHLPSGEGDLALIHFKGNLPEGYQPVKLANENLSLKAGQKVLMIGYGVINGEAETGSGKLRQTTTLVIGRHSPTEIVTDGKKSSVCFGDSGGPAFIKIKNEFFQWGVASSVANRSCDESSIHTEVMKYEPWIQASIAKLQH